MAANHNLPVHVAIIPDGNRRWAKKHCLDPWIGHANGVKRFEEIADALFRHNIPYCTFWAASIDNLLKRNKKEIDYLVGLMKKQLNARIKSAEKDKIRFFIFGRGQSIVNDQKLDALISKLEKKTEGYAKRTLTILFGYDGFDEMATAVNKIINSRPTVINYETIKNALWTQDLPPVDLVIRTGELFSNWTHLSAGFMMWLTGNSKIYSPPVFWPDFTEKELDKALEECGKEKRRFGA
jgi:undecaprenyl diphosphate synthase